MHRFDVRKHQFFGIGGCIHILYDALDDLCGHVGIQGRVGGDPAVIAVAHVVKRRNIEPFQLGNLAQEGGTSIAAVFFHFDIEVAEFGERFFSFADAENVKEIRDRLGVVAARPAADHDRIPFPAVAGIDRHTAELQGCQHVGVAKLVLQSKAEDIERRDRVTAFVRGQRNIAVAHMLLHIRPGGIYTLTPYVRHRV